MATKKKNAPAPEVVEDAKVEEAAAGAADEAVVEEKPAKASKTKSVKEGYGYEVGKTYASTNLLPIYDKIGGQIVGTLYKNNSVTVKDILQQGQKTYLQIDDGFVVANDGVKYIV